MEKEEVRKYNKGGSHKTKGRRNWGNFVALNEWYSL